MKINTADYAKALFEMTKEKTQAQVDGIVLDFAKFLMKKKQSGKVGKISEQFSSIWNKENKTIDCEVSSVEKLDEVVLEKIRHHIKEKYQVEVVNIENKIEKKLKGGIVMRMGDEMVDMSISGMLFQLKKQLEN